jgi:hypothetical protein
VTGLSNLNAPTYYDPSLGRPPRSSQYNIAVQREFLSGLTPEAAYVGKRGAWLQRTLKQLNSVTPTILSGRGLSPSNPGSIGVGNPITVPTYNSNHQLSGGFGFVNVNNIAAGTARNMLVVARLAF